MVKIQSEDFEEVGLWQKHYDDLESLNVYDNNDEMDVVKNVKFILAKKIAALKRKAKADANKGLIHRKFDKEVFPESLEQLKNAVRIITIYNHI